MRLRKFRREKFPCSFFHILQLVHAVLEGFVAFCLDIVLLSAVSMVNKTPGGRMKREACHGRLVFFSAGSDQGLCQQGQGAPR